LAARSAVWRYGASGLVARLSGSAFPLGTMAVNVSGAIMIGFFAGLSIPEGRVLIPAGVRIFVMTGICGGYTTFSTFSLETLNLMRDGEWAWALANVTLSVALCLIAAWIGFALALELGRPKGV
jgi:CrcB protein